MMGMEVVMGVSRKMIFWCLMWVPRDVHEFLIALAF